MINYLILHLLFIVYALNTVLGRMAAPYSRANRCQSVQLEGAAIRPRTVFRA